MKLLWKILGVLLGLIILLAVVAFFLPRRYQVERSIVIAAKPETVFPLVADLAAWKRWGVWYQRDPTMTLSYSSATTTVGGWTAWRSKSEGNGRATLTAVQPSQKVTYTLEMEGMSMLGEGAFILTPVPGGTRVDSVMSGDLGLNPMARWFGLFLDRMVGPDFEQGLVRLKQIAETTP